MSTPSRFASPAAFRRSLTDSIKAAVAEQFWSFGQLQRQVAYDRLLDRLYVVDDGWILKGATALLARDVRVRGSLDIDLYRRVAREVAEADLRRAAQLDLSDGFRFQVGVGAPIADSAVRLPIESLIGGTVWAAFSVDLLGADLTMTGHRMTCRPLPAA